MWNVLYFFGSRSYAIASPTYSTTRFRMLARYEVLELSGRFSIQLKLLRLCFQWNRNMETLPKHFLNGSKNFVSSSKMVPKWFQNDLKHDSVPLRRVPKCEWKHAETVPKFHWVTFLVPPPACSSRFRRCCERWRPRTPGWRCARSWANTSAAPAPSSRRPSST